MNIGATIKTSRRKKRGPQEDPFRLSPAENPTISCEISKLVHLDFSLDFRYPRIEPVTKPKGECT